MMLNVFSSLALTTNARFGGPYPSRVICENALFKFVNNSTICARARASHTKSSGLKALADSTSKVQGPSKRKKGKRAQKVENRLKVSTYVNDTDNRKHFFCDRYFQCNGVPRWRMEVSFEFIWHDSRQR